MSSDKPEARWIALVREMVDADEFKAPGPHSPPEEWVQMPWARWQAIDRFARMTCRELDCAEENFRVTNKAYVEADRKLRALPSAERRTIKYERRPELDRRIRNGDDFAGDAYVRWVAPGETPNDETLSPAAAESLISITDASGSTHTRKAWEWLDLSREALSRRATSSAKLPISPEIIQLAQRWAGVHTDESYGPQGKNLGILARAVLDTYSATSESTAKGGKRG